MPANLSIGTASKDKPEDLKFWGDFAHEDPLKKKKMDIQYIDIKGGPIKAPSDMPDAPFNLKRKRAKALKYAKESMRFGMIPFFKYSNLSGDDDSFKKNLSRMQSKRFMEAYFKDLKAFLEDVQDVVGDDGLYGIVLEEGILADLQKATNAKPDKIKTVVGLTYEDTVAGVTVSGYELKESYVIATPNADNEEKPYDFADTLDKEKAVPGVDGSVADMVKAINYVIKTFGGNVVFGWEIDRLDSTQRSVA